MAAGIHRFQAKAGGARERNARNGDERVTGAVTAGTTVAQAIERAGSAGGAAATAFCNCEEARQVPQLRAAPSVSEASASGCE